MPKSTVFFAAIAVLCAQLPIAHAAGNCNAKASLPWNAGKHKLTLEAISNGPECGKAVVLLVVRDARGEPLWTFASPAASVAIFSPEHTSNGKNMVGALKEWLAVGLESGRKDMGALPDWKPGALGPAEDPPAEFPFTVSENLGRETYVEWRAARLPLFCFVQGMESANCIAITDEGTVTEVGIQSFPG